MLRYLLDTNIAIYVIKCKPLSALRLFNEHAGHMAISSITLAELLHGAGESNAPSRSLAVVEDFCSRLEVLTEQRRRNITGAFAARLETQGRIIGINDLHIVAHARSEGLTLVSNNLREFERIEALQLANWAI